MRLTTGCSRQRLYGVRTLRLVAAQAAFPAFAGLGRLAEDVAGEDAAMTRRAILVHGLGRPFGDRRRRGDRQRRLGDANRLRRGRVGAAALRPRFGWLCRLGGLRRLGRRRRRGGRRRLDQARQDASGRRAGAAAVSTTGRGGGSALRAAPFVCGFCSSSTQEAGGSPGGRRCRRTSTTNEREGRFIALRPLRALRNCRARPTRIAARRLAAAPC